MDAPGSTAAACSLITLRQNPRGWIYRRFRSDRECTTTAPNRGVVLGAALFAGMMTMLLATGTYVLTGPTAAVPWRALMESLEGAMEELIFRGAIFRLLWRAFGVWWALGLSSALFGMMHLAKPG